MRITIFGSGYVGLVTGACLADAGNHVVCVDVDERKIAMLKRGEVPIHEPGLDGRGQTQLRGRAGCASPPTPRRACDHGLFQLIAVGTPPDEDGSADLRHVLGGGPHHRRAHGRVQGGDHQIDGAGGHRRQGARRGRERRSRSARRQPSSSTRSRIRNSSRRARPSTTS